MSKKYDTTLAVTHPNTPELMTISELAEFLRVPKSTIYRWTSQRPDFPRYKIGRFLKFEKSEVLRYFKVTSRSSKPQSSHDLDALMSEVRSLKTESNGGVTNTKEVGDADQ